MRREFIETMLDYIDKKIEYEFASREEEEDGQRGSCIEERKTMEKAKETLMHDFKNYRGDLHQGDK